MNIPKPSAHATVGSLILSAFSAIAGLAYAHPTALQNPAAAGILGTFAALATTVVQYYFGSSAGSATKTAIMAAQATAPAAPAQQPSVTDPTDAMKHIAPQA